MKISNVNIKEMTQKVKNGVQKVGENGFEYFSKVNSGVDSFVSKKGANPKEFKQLCLGAAIAIVTAKLVSSCVKGIVNKVKEKAMEK